MGLKPNTPEPLVALSAAPGPGAQPWELRCLPRRNVLTGRAQLTLLPDPAQGKAPESLPSHPARAGPRNAPWPCSENLPPVSKNWGQQRTRCSLFWVARFQQLLSSSLASALLEKGDWAGRNRTPVCDCDSRIFRNTATGTQSRD